MSGSWRHLAIALLGAALLLPGSAVAAMDQADLKELESLLQELGFDPGPVDGVVDDDTISAIRRYQDFALLPGEPKPSEKLLDELRGVAAAYAALNAEKAKTSSTAPSAGEPPAAEPTTNEPTANEPPANKPTANEPPATEPPPAGADGTQVPAKVVVPPPPPPPKLKPLGSAAEAAPDTHGDAAPQSEPKPQPAPPQVAALPPAQDGEKAQDEGQQPSDAAATPTPVEPVDEQQARIDAELAPYRAQLKDGSLSREKLAKKFNSEGRKLMQAAEYDAAILKFAVAIQLDPEFAGAYSNRGTAYQRQDEPDLAKKDFDKAKQLGFGGLRLRTGKNPL